MKYQVTDDLPMQQTIDDVTWIIDRYFGTPDQPSMPDVIMEDPELSAVVDLERLNRAAGPDVEGRGLYRKHCALCHGITGNGRGTTAAVLVPYPRDYRMGVFKFKSTERGAKPTREDIAKSIRNGIAGTAMKKIPELSEDDIQALTDYVIYLSIRGELERALIDDAVNELDLEGGDRVLNTEFAAKMSEETVANMEQAIEDWKSGGKKEEDEPKDLDAFELYQESMEITEDYLVEIVEDWLDAEDHVIQVPDRPTDFPVANSRAEYVKLTEGDQAETLAASVKRGQELFVGKIAACSKCHGEKGLGDGQTKDYDDWTKDWTTRVGLKPEERESLIPLLARGALPPINAVPRNFADGYFHGGSDSSDLYLRIVNGIEGTPMPAATFVEGQFEPVDVWHLINFIRSLQKSDGEEDVQMPEPEPMEMAGPAVGGATMAVN
jgi:mono/diheme cytochrome c family protein